MNDPELKAMADAYAAIEPLDAEAQGRVMVWLHKRLGLPESPASTINPSGTGTGTGTGAGDRGGGGGGGEYVPASGEVARALGLTDDEVELIFDIDEDSLNINIPTKMLPDKDAELMRELAFVATTASEALKRQYDRKDLKVLMKAFGRSTNNVNRDLGAVAPNLLRLKGENLMMMKDGRAEAQAIAQRWAGRSE